jgi:hypothetical protein
MKFSTEEIQQEILNWCQYHYQDNVAGIALFDPKPVNEAFPSGDINVLLILYTAPLEQRQRYDLVAERLVNSLVPDRVLTCRIQTVDEIQSLANLQMPLLAIYLNSTEILYDPKHVLAQARQSMEKE